MIGSEGENSLRPAESDLNRKRRLGIVNFLKFTVSQLILLWSQRNACNIKGLSEDIGLTPHLAWWRIHDPLLNPYAH